MTRYHSERMGHEAPRDREELTEVAAKGIGAMIRGLASSNAFASSFPARCRRCSGREVSHSDTGSFWDTLAAVVPELQGWPQKRRLPDIASEGSLFTLFVFDAIEFCWQHVADVQRDTVYSSGIRSLLNFEEFLSQQEDREHIHLRLDRGTGQEDFRAEVETILRRNGIAYTLTSSGRVERILSPELDESIRRAEFTTGDEDLDELLTTARGKFLDPKPEVRLEALQKLWDAWERLKTMGAGSGKRLQTKAVLDKAAGSNSPLFREALEKEARELTDLGNDLQIRHFEIGKEKLATTEHVDYLFQRMFSLIWMILRAQKMVGVEK